MEKTNKDVSAHIASLPDEFRPSVERLDQIISEIMIGHSRVLWEGIFWGGSEQAIIGYGDLIAYQKRGKKVEWFLVGLAVQKNYISIYVSAVEDGQYAAEKYRSELGKVKVGKSNISFENVDDLDIPTLKKVLFIARDQSAVQA